MAQTVRAGAPAKSSAAPVDSKLAWNQLSDRQQAALQPLAPIWSQVSANRKRKWIALSADFDKLSPNDKIRLHGRMREWAALSNVERNRARLNFAQTRTLSSEEKKAHWEAYQALSPDQRQQLARQAAKRPATGAAPAVTHRSTGKLAAVPVTRSERPVASTPVPSPPVADPEPGASAATTTSP